MHAWSELPATAGVQSLAANVGASCMTKQVVWRTAMNWLESSLTACMNTTEDCITRCALLLKIWLLFARSIGCALAWLSVPPRPRPQGLPRCKLALKACTQLAFFLKLVEALVTAHG